MVLIDVQERLFPHIHDHAAMLQKIQTLIQGLHVLGVPRVVTQQYTQGLGPTVAALTLHIADTEVIEKRSFSCCDEPRFLLKLHEWQRQFVFLAGIETHVCVLQTVVDLKELGYSPVVVADAVSSRFLYDKQVALDRMKKEGAFITTVESILLELCRSSASDTFKRISTLIK